MWSRPLFLLWFSMDKHSDKQRIRFAFPLPLFVLPMFLEMLDDLIDFANLISIGHLYKKNNSMYSPYMARKWIHLLQNMMSEVIWKGEPDDILDIDVMEGDHGEHLKMKLLLR